MLGSPDAALLDRWHERRDANAFREIALRHSSMVFGACLRILGNRADAQDVAQEVFLRLARGDVRINVSLSGWLHTLATRRALDRIRDERNQRNRECRYASAQASTSEASWDDLQPLIDEAIAQLPERLRVPLVEHFLENRSHEEIAQELGLTRSGITRRISKGLKELRRSLRRKGISIDAAGFGLILEHIVLEEPPAELTRSIGKMAISGMGQAGQAASSPALSLALEGVGAMSKLKLAAFAALALLAVSSGLIFLGYGAAEAPIPAPLNPDAIRPAGAPPARDETSTPSTPETDGSSTERTPNSTDEAIRMAVVGETGSGKAGALPVDFQASHPMGPVLGSVSGRVIDSDSKPISDAAVEASGENLSGQARTKRDGSFEIALRAEDTSGTTVSDGGETLVLVSASGEGYVTATQTRVPLGTTDVELVLTKEAYIQGWVVDASTGKPIPEFEARISRHKTPTEGPQPTREPWTAFSSPEGKFVLPTTLAVTELDARARGYRWAKKELSLEQGEILEGLVVELEPGVVIRGIVLDRATREPVENAWAGIAVGQNAMWRLLREDEYDAKTGSDGRFEIASAAGQDLVDIKVWRHDYAPEFVINHDTRSSSEVTVLLSQGGTLRGQVTQNGKPLSGLRIHVRQAFGRPHVTNVTPPETPSFLTWTGTDPEGRYEFTHLAYGRYILRIINTSPHIPLRERYLVRMWVDVEEGKTVELHHELTAYGAVYGQIAGLADYQGVSVSICDARYPDEPMYMTGEKHDANGPDEYGAFAFGPVETGEYIARVHLPGTPPRVLEQKCTVSSGEPVELLFQAKESANAQTSASEQGEGR